MRAIPADAVRSTYVLGGAIELARIQERTNRAFETKFRQTEHNKPSHRPPYSHRKFGTGSTATYKIDPAEPLMVRRIYDKRAAGAS